LDEVGRLLMAGPHEFCLSSGKWIKVHQGASGLDFMLLHIYM
jgi:hypothetical protein